MILYHGSNILIQNINLNICKPFKDFGRGFYTTENEEQAKNMAKRTTKFFGGLPFVISFSCNYQELIKMNMKVFESPTDEWAIFVLNNRNKSFKDISNQNCNLDNKYDIVSGPIANDDIKLLFNLFEDDIITIDELRNRLKYKELSMQYSFHTIKSIQLLSYIKEYNL